MDNQARGLARLKAGNMSSAPDQRLFNDAPSLSGGSRRHSTLAFALVTSLFFMWALAHNLNDILIKHFENALALSRSQASFIQVSFYLAYFLFALPAGYAMKRMGLKRTMLLGLGLYAAGAAAFYPAANVGTFDVFLVALFVIGGGIVCLEIAAGAFIVLAGSPARAAFRINLAQAFNGLGAIVSPVIGGAFILSRGGILYPPQPTAAQMRALELHQVQTPYLTIAASALLLLILLLLTPFPATSAARRTEHVSYGRLFRQRQFTAAAIAQFFYVGAQVAVWSFFIDFVKDVRPGTSDSTGAYLLSVSLIFFTAGRFGGAILLRRVHPSTVLAAFGALACCALIGAVTTSGNASLGCLIAISLFMSIMYPTLFAIGVTAAGRQGEIGAAVLVMTIVGGAVIPSALGLTADHVGVRLAYLILLVSFLIIMTVGLLTRGGKPPESVQPQLH
jgi:MFS transporter, FHS family, L-fucose permease